MFKRVDLRASHLARGEFAQCIFCALCVPMAKAVRPFCVLPVASEVCVVLALYEFLEVDLSIEG
eukprot:12169514-Prorocentrum_lima.AAC.1